MLSLKYHAYRMYVEQGFTAKHIIETLRINKNTFTRWRKEGRWSQFREEAVAAPIALTNAYYYWSHLIVDKVNSMNAMPLKREIDMINVLASAVSKIEKQKDPNLDLTILADFCSYVKRNHPEALEVIIPVTQNFMRNRFKVEDKAPRKKQLSHKLQVIEIENNAA